MEERANTLRAMKICRFCLTETEPLTNIYERDVRDGKHTIPLPLQIMACVAIEVFANDGMPQMICKTCRFQTTQAYTFKTTCKKSDDALKLYLATGKLVKPDTNQPIIQTNEILNTKNVKTRLREQTKPENKKKIKTEEMVTLNYSTSLDITNASANEAQQDCAQSCANIIGHASDDSLRLEMEEEVDVPCETRNEEYEEQEYFEGEEEEEEEEEEEDNINPVLKVPQVKTDVFPCPHCERSFPLQQLLDIHAKNHERERSFACMECGRKFFTKYDLGKHVQTHSDDKPFACVICRKNFSRESLLHRHEKIHVDVPKYLCTSCDKTFLTREDLDAHSEKHKKRRPFTCRLCKKSFVFKQGLERHEMTHANEKPHKCNYCEASFTSPIKLTRHITSHAGLRPYPCKLCGRTFLLSHHLTRHMRSHYASSSPMSQLVGQHKCDVCSMSFRRKDSLINHSAIHSMVNLKCVICNTAFDSAKMVKEHITTHLSGLPYPCDKCEYSFDTQDQLEEHELKHAEMEYEEQIEQEFTQETRKHNDEETGDCSDEEVTEFTITNNIENPEVIRRSKREPKIKNYAQFLKDELGSDLEDEVVEMEDSEEFVLPSRAISPEETIKPVIRSEGTKVYARKNLPEKPKIVPELKFSSSQIAPPEQINQSQITTLETLGLSKQAVSALPNKRFVDMKIGDKTVRIQKLIMTKAEIDAMARDGKIEMKGNTILLKNSAPKVQENKEPQVFKGVTIESILGNPKSSSTPRMSVKKTYVRKVVQNQTSEESRGNTDGDIPISVEEQSSGEKVGTVIQKEASEGDQEKA